MSSDADADADVAGQELVARELKRYREQAGLSLNKLASRIGYSRTYVSNIEKPGVTLVSAEVVRHIDEELRAGGALIELRERADAERQARRAPAGAVARRSGPVTALSSAEPSAWPRHPTLKRDQPGTTSAPPVSAAIADLCDTLTTYDIPATESNSARQRNTEGSSIGMLRRDLDATFDAYQQSRFSVSASRTSTLIADAQEAVRVNAGTGRRQAFGVLALSCQAAASVLIKAGMSDLAWVVAERGLNASVESENLAIRGSLLRSVTFSLLSAGQLQAAMRLAETGAAHIEPDVGDDETMLSVYGMLFLAAAMAAARFGDAARAAGYLQEADDAANRMGRDSNRLWTAFGPTNVAIHRANTAAELGDMGTVLKPIPGFGTCGLPAERKVRYLLDVARAREVTGDRGRALVALLSAERISPEHMQQHYLTKKVVTTMVRASPGRPSPELEKMAKRVGVVG